MLTSRRPRALARAAAATLVRRLPRGLSDGMRTSYATSPPGTLRESLLRRGLEVVRHAGVPLDTRTFTLGSNPAIQLVAADSLVLQRLFWFGERGWEGPAVRWWRECVNHASSILELGANVGYYTTIAGTLRPDVRYVAVEPHPHSAAILRENLLLNGIVNVDVREAAAVSDDRPVVDLLIPSDDHFAAPAGAFVDAASELSSVTAQMLSVPAVSFQALAQDADLIKLDVEGQEYQLLSSALSQIVRNRAVLLVEMLDDAQLLRMLVRDTCERHSYVAAQPTMDALRGLSVADVAQSMVKQRAGTRDILLLPTEHPLAAQVSQ